MTLNPDIKTKKPKKRIRERDVVKQFEKRLAELAVDLGVSVKSDHPSSSEYGTAGRPDLYCALGGMEFKVEAKRDAQARLSGVQITWHEDFNQNHVDMFTLPVLMLWGIGSIEPLISHIKIQYVLRQKRIRLIERMEREDADD
jgi:hypothetical protein